MLILPDYCSKEVEVEPNAYVVYTYRTYEGNPKTRMVDKVVVFKNKTRAERHLYEQSKYNNSMDIWIRPIYYNNED